MQLSEKIPLIYHHLLPELLAIELPDEIIANCSSCNLCKTPKSPYLETKCCNYHPVQVNYLLGGVLSDSDKRLESGKIRIRKQLAEQKGVSAFGIRPNAEYVSNQERILLSENAFHTKKEIDSQLCPYYDKGNCTVWKYREHLCVTYFCSSIGGEAGHRFWKNLNSLLQEIEEKLALYAADKLGFSLKPDAEIPELTSEKQVAFYIACYEEIRLLDYNTFQTLMGENFSIKVLTLLEDAKVFRQKSFPEYLGFHPQMEISTTPSGNLILSVNQNKTEISPVVYSLLRFFDGKRTTQAVFDKAFEVLYNLNDPVSVLIEKGILIGERERG